MSISQNGANAGDTEQDHARERARLVREIEDDFRSTANYTGIDRMSERVRRSLLHVPRHRFVDAEDPAQAYANYPLSIGHGQTISQPFIVALMTELLDLQGAEKVLEVGTGSGYQAAVLAELADSVYTIEIIEPLGVAAAERLRSLGYRNVAVRIGDGNAGWPEHAPFSAIIVTAAGRLPPALIEQLKPGGRIVVPIEEDNGSQMLTVVRKDARGVISSTEILPVRFVPLTGDN